VAQRPEDRELAEVLATLTRIDDSGARSQRVPELLRLTARSARAAGARAVASGRWAADLVTEMAGHLPVRDVATLRAHHDGLSGDALATRLIDRAALATGAVGALVGGLATVEELTPAAWPTLPVELVAETLLVVAIEMKLVAELHVAAGRPISGSFTDQAVAITAAWAERRGIEPGVLLQGGAADLLGRQARLRLSRTLQRRLVRRGGRSVASFAPLLAGAAAGGILNRRATRAVGEQVNASLRGRR
jgi:hypothetical protein